MKLEWPVGTLRFIPFKGKTVTVAYCADGLWRSPDGCIFGYPNKDYDPEDAVCGVWLLHMPEGDLMNELAAPHDYEYECPVYQLYHTRKEADEELLKRFKTAAGWRRVLAYPFYALVRLFGGILWENAETR